MVSANKKVLLICVVLGIYGNLFSQVLYNEKDVQQFNSIISQAEKINLSDSSIDKIVLQVGKQFTGRPYVGGVLDVPETESLVIDLSQLDCVTFLENTLALAIIIKSNKKQFEDFCNELRFIRYRRGVLDGYVSRLHYFYDWINDNQKKGILENITATIGGKLFIKQINIMSGNRAKYAHLKDENAWNSIKKIEEELSSMNKFFVPKQEIKLAESKIHDGDLIAFATSVEGLDIAHVGIAIHVNGTLHLLHASSLNRKVEISDVSLSEMIAKKPSYTGIVVSRLNSSH
jgi:hypothetical protein